MQHRKALNPTTFRWSKEDQRRDYPKRFKRILDNCGCTFAGCTAALIRCFVEEVEGRGLPLYRGASKKVADMAEKKLRERKSDKQKRSRRK